MGDGQLASERQVEHPAGASNLFGSADTNVLVSGTTLSALTTRRARSGLRLFLSLPPHGSCSPSKVAQYVPTTTNDQPEGG
jgi:hypothetical protein